MQWCFYCWPAGAAAVYLQNGEVITGTIIEINDSFMMLQTRQERLRIPLDKVESIELSDR